MTETGTAAIDWVPRAGALVRLHAPRGSEAERALDPYLGAAEATASVLADLLGGPQQDGPVDVYLVDPLPDAAAHNEDDAVGDRGAVHVVQAEEPPVAIAPSVARALVARWFGSDAAAARVIVDGLAGFAAAAAGAGPDLEDADGLVRARLEAGEEVSALAYDGDTAVATSFVGHLMKAGGPESLANLLRSFRPERRDEAIIAVYQRPLAALEEEWMAGLFEDEEGGSPFSSVRFLLPLLRPHLPKYFEAVAYMVVAVLFTISVPIVSGCLVEALGRQGGGPPAEGFCAVVAPSLTQTRVVTVVLILFVAYLIEWALSLRRTYVEGMMFNHIGLELRERMFAHLLRLPHRFYAGARVGDITARLSDDLDEVQAAMQQIFGGGVLMAMTSVLAAITALTQNLAVGALIILLIPVFLLVNKMLGPRIASGSFEAQRLAGDSASVLQESLTAHSVIKAFGLEKRSIAAYRARLDAAARAGLRLVLIGQIYEGTINFATTISQLIVLGLGSVLVIAGSIDEPGKLVTLLLLLPAIIVPVGSLADIGQVAQMAAGSIRRAREILEEPVDIEEKPDAVDLPTVSKEIRFENVTFGYEPDRQILKDLTLTIPKGMNLAIVGPSGSGKSTIVNLLVRFWDPDEGRITFDGIDIRDATLASLRGQIGMVFQETFIFNSTVRDNIGIGRPDASDAEIEAASQAARLDSFVGGLPAGFDTVLGEHGVRMSGGQRQRLAIARALLRDPEILILDEATSALDARTEAEILDTLAEVAKARTTIAITHRLSMATAADHVVVLEGGRLVEQGHHSELVTAGGLYQRLYQEQTGQPDASARAGLEAARLRKVPLFARLSQERLGELSRRLVLERFSAGEDIVRQGGEGDKLYVVARGSAEVLVRNGHAERRVNELREGDYFGDYALLTGTNRTATVRALQPTSVYSLARDDLLEMIEQEPDLQELVAAFIDERRAAFEAAAAAAGIDSSTEASG